MKSSHWFELAPDDLRAVHGALCWVEPTGRQFVADEIDRMLKADILKHATTGFAIPKTFAQKMDRSLWFYVDYWKLNDLTFRDSYLPFGMH